MTATQFIEEQARILRNEEPRFDRRGDMVRNARGLRMTLKRENPALMDRIALELLSDLNKFSDISDLHPDRVKQLANSIKAA
jgi:hypothetical protein